VMVLSPKKAVKPVAAPTVKKPAKPAVVAEPAVAAEAAEAVEKK